MGLGGFVLGGALAGVGKGMAMQAEQTALERREARLQAARDAERQENRQWEQEDAATADQRLAERDQRQHNYRVTEAGVEAKAQASLAEMRDGSKPFSESYDFDRGEMVYLWRDKNAPGGVREDRRKINPNKPAGSDNPQVVTPQVDADGNPVVFVEQGGRVSAQRIEGVKLPPKGSGEGGGSKRKVKDTGINWEGHAWTLYDDGTYAGPKDRRSMADLKKDYPDDYRYAQSRLKQIGRDRETVARGPQPKQDKGGGIPRMKTDAEADAFASNPANKGKQFVGPDGKTYKL